MAQRPAAIAVSVVSGVTAGAGSAGPWGCQLRQQRRPRGVAVAAVQVQAAQARSAAGDDQRPDEDPVALHDDRQVGHRAPQPRRAGLGGQRAGRGQDHQLGHPGGGVVAQVEVQRLRGHRAGVDPPDPAGAQQRGEGLREGALAADDDVLAAPGREQRVTVAGQPVGRRQGVRVRAQGRPPGLAEVTQEGAVGRQVEQQVPFAQRLQQPRHPRRRDAGPCGQGVQGRQVQAAVQPRDQRHLGLAQALEDDAGVAGHPHLQRAASPPQDPRVRLEPGSGRHTAPSCGTSGSGCRTATLARR